MKKGLMIVNNKVEDIEALATRDLLIRSGLNITLATLESSKTITTSYGITMFVDRHINEISADDFDFLVLPGGSHVFDWIDKEVGLTAMINDFNSNNKLIAAICAAPLFLSKAGILTNSKFTAFPSVVEDIKGVYETNSKVVVLDNIITARSAGVVFDFAFEIIKKVLGNDKVKELKNSIVY